MVVSPKFYFRIEFHLYIWEMGLFFKMIDQLSCLITKIIIITTGFDPTKWTMKINWRHVLTPKSDN